MMLGRCKQTWEARLLFRSMKSEGLQPTVEVYTALVSAYGESGQFDKAFSTVDEMKTVSDCRPDVYTYSVLIQCCIKHYRFDLIGRILAEMSYLGVECNTITFNIIIEGYGKAEMFEKMENSLTDMVESGSSIPDTSTLNSVIGAYGNSGQIEKMEKWYSEFQLMGIHPDIQTFNILMTSYGKAGMHKKIKSILKFMEERFFTPTIVTYNIIIEAFGRVGDIEKMDEYFETMKHQGVKPNAITYCSLVRAYSKAGLMTKVDSILRQVVNSDVVLDTPFFNCIISAYGLAGDIETMTELFLAMEERKCKPNNITFETLIRAFKAQGMTEVAQQFENKILAAKENSGRRRYYVYSSRRMIEA
ncbi:hypothetical protein JCGZ_16847 [Jatropha curcas]|uniref:Pentacotripeptide-repeat region of PRORP domain-containing protein n=2 Tax=Jatropha curcas TaxID=180498 RepID=A0A067LG73_JATCU|nr:hypothetical protein JCGZ_16847 [Jatropha curcas]